MLCAREGRLDEAQELLKQAETRIDPSHPKELGWLMCHRGVIALEAGDLQAAHRAHQRASEIAAELKAGPRSDLASLLCDLEARLNAEEG